jgi:hypothetical protein
VESILFWSEDSDRVCGCKADFDTKEDFIKQVKDEFKSFKGKECAVTGVRVEACVFTEKGLNPEMLIPLSATDIEIANYYAATVDEVYSQ